MNPSMPSLPDGEPRERPGLGVWMASALVAGNMIGSGVFLLPASLAPFGGIGLLGWGFTAAGAVLLALVFARLGRFVPRIGGPYAYARMGFGDFVGFEVAWGYWISIWTGNAAIAVAFVGYLDVFVPGLADEPVTAALAAVAAVWVLTGVNVAGVRAAGWVQLVTTAGKLLPLLAVGFAGVFALRPDHFVPFNASGEPALSALTSVAAITLWAFLGLESASIPAEDIDDPARTIPRATVLGTLVAAAVYILGTAAVMGVVPPDELAGSTAPFADAARSLWGPEGRYFVALGALFSTFGALNGWILLQGQMPLAAARDGLFPERFGERGRRGTPTFGLIFSSVLLTGVMATNYAEGLVGVFNFTLLLATVAVLVAYLFTAMAALLLYLTRDERFGDPSAAARIVAALACLYALWAVAGSGRDAVYWGALLLGAGIPVYVWVRWRREGAERADS